MWVWQAAEERGLRTSRNQSSPKSEEAGPVVSMPKTTIETLPHRTMCHCIRTEDTLASLDCDSCNCVQACDSVVEDEDTTKGLSQIYYWKFWLLQDLHTELVHIRELVFLWLFLAETTKFFKLKFLTGVYAKIYEIDLIWMVIHFGDRC